MQKHNYNGVLHVIGLYSTYLFRTVLMFLRLTSRTPTQSSHSTRAQLRQGAILTHYGVVLVSCLTACIQHHPDRTFAFYWWVRLKDTSPKIGIAAPACSSAKMASSIPSTSAPRYVSFLLVPWPPIAVSMEDCRRDHDHTQITETVIKIET